MNNANERIKNYSQEQYLEYEKELEVYFYIASKSINLRNDMDIINSNILQLVDRKTIQRYHNKIKAEYAKSVADEREVNYTSTMHNIARLSLIIFHKLNAFF